MSSELRTHGDTPPASPPRPGSGSGRFPAVLLTVAALTAVLFALAAHWRFDDTTSTDSTPPTAADMTSRLDRVAEGLRHAPIYTDPESPDPFEHRERSALRDRIEALDVPVHLAAVPSAYEDESAGDSLLFAHSLHKALGRDGLYVIADPVEGDIELANYGARLDTAYLEAVPDSITGPDYDAPANDPKLAERLDKLVSYLAKSPSGPPGSVPYEPLSAPDPVEEDALPGPFSGDFVPGVLLGIFGASAFTGLAAVVLWAVRQYLVGRAAARAPGVRLSKDAVEWSAPHSKLLRRVAATVAAVVGLVLTILAANSPESFGLGASPALFEAVSDRGRALEGIIIGWYLITVPLAGLLQTAVALYRRARIGTGWTLLVLYWAIGLLVAVAAWYVADAFPAHGGRGRSGGLFGAALTLVLGVPAVYACSGAVFVRRQAEGGEAAGLIRGQIGRVALGVLGMAGLFGGMISATLAVPKQGAYAMFWPGAGWGGALGASFALALCGAAEVDPSRREQRRELLLNAARWARLSALIFAVALSVAQLGWFLPAALVGLASVPAVVAALIVLSRRTRLRGWFHVSLPQPRRDQVD
ncbi:hypothetical protein [Streptomyces sp. NPDC051776]|uniref:hypothetical protein n=1 Tax=Streptomyces sp. NPDC051776 TaxID=3155414 RepID=UPI0034370AA2